MIAVEELMNEIMVGYKTDNRVKIIVDKIFVTLQEYEKEVSRYINDDDLKIPVPSKETAELIVKFLGHAAKLYHFAREQLELKNKS